MALFHAVMKKLIVAFWLFHPFPSVLKEGRVAMVASSETIHKSPEASVLRELKETIRNQQIQIEGLKNQLSHQSTRADSSAPSHVGHGAKGKSSKEELASYVTEPFYRIASKRIGWLSLFLVSLSMTALIMNGFEHTLERQLELAYFVPLLAGHGGNTGGQAVGTVLSALSAGVVTLHDAPRIVSKEALSGLAVGSALGMLVGTVAHYIMGISIHVAAVVLCTLPLVSTLAAALGSTIPFACIAVGLDPAVIAAPAMTSFVDVTGLMSYFLIANQIFSMLGIEM